MFVSELKVLVSGFLATGETGGVETRDPRELKHDSVSLSSVAADLLLLKRMREVRGGLTGGDLTSVTEIARRGAALTSNSSFLSAKVRDTGGVLIDVRVKTFPLINSHCLLRITGKPSTL